MLLLCDEQEMDEERQERREEEEETEEERTLKTPPRRREEEEEEEEEMMKAGSKDSKVISGHTPISASSSFTSFPFLSSSLCRGRGGEEDEVRVAIVTIEDESCPSEPFGTAHLETANQITRTENGGDGKEVKEYEEEEDEEANCEERKEEEEENTEVHLQSQVGLKLYKDGNYFYFWYYYILF